MIIILTLLTVFFILLLVLIPANNSTRLHNISLISVLCLFTVSLLLLGNPLTSIIYVEIGSLSVISLPAVIYKYSYMLDNISIIFVVLATLLGFIVVMITRNIKYRLKEKYILLLIVELLLIQCFTAIEIIFFYLCFEALLIPIYSLIGIWGSQKEKIFAANQFFLYTLFGSFFMLIAIILLTIFTGTTNILLLKGYVYSAYLEQILFWLFFISFAVKIPMIPVHLWLPKAHVEAPTTGSVLLAGILLKLGSYGFLRFLLFLFPKASFYFLPIILSIALISIIFASFTVLRQVDLKRIIAYSSIAHMNYLVSALFVKNLFALTGSLLLQIAHGLSSSALFFIIGILYDRYKSRNIFYYRGLVMILPFICFFFFVFSLANLGFPSTINFVSEMLIFFGLFTITPSMAILSLIGIFLSAIYSFILVTRLAFGPTSKHIYKFFDISRREFYTLTPLVFLIFVFGLFPDYLLSFWNFTIFSWFIDDSTTFLLIPAGLFPLNPYNYRMPYIYRKLFSITIFKSRQYVRYYYLHHLTHLSEVIAMIRRYVRICTNDDDAFVTCPGIEKKYFTDSEDHFAFCCLSYLARRGTDVSLLVIKEEYDDYGLRKLICDGFYDDAMRYEHNMPRLPSKYPLPPSTFKPLTAKYSVPPLPTKYPFPSVPAKSSVPVTPKYPFPSKYPLPAVPTKYSVPPLPTKYPFPSVPAKSSVPTKSSVPVMYSMDRDDNPMCYDGRLYVMYHNK